MLDHTGCIELDLGLLCERRSQIGADYLVYLAVSRRSFNSMFSDPRPRPRLATGWMGEACMLNATHSLGLILVTLNINSKMLCRDSPNAINHSSYLLRAASGDRRLPLIFCSRLSRRPQARLKPFPGDHISTRPLSCTRNQSRNLTRGR